MLADVSERIDGPTPSGGVYMVAYFRDKFGNPETKDAAYQVEIHEYDDEDKVIMRTHGFTNTETALKSFPGHKGRPGKRGGSLPKGAVSRPAQSDATLHVITETNVENAKIILTQGLDPGFKPDVPTLTEYKPGLGIERSGTYVSDPTAFTRGSYGPIRIHILVSDRQLDMSPEMLQLGRTDLTDALMSENGAITLGKIGAEQISSVEWYKDGKWNAMTPDDFLREVGVNSVPKLPTVDEYGKWLRRNAKRLFLDERRVEDLIHDYNRGTLQDKIEMVSEIS